MTARQVTTCPSQPVTEIKASHRARPYNFHPVPETLPLYQAILSAHQFPPTVLHIYIYFLDPQVLFLRSCKLALSKPLHHGQNVSPTAGSPHYSDQVFVLTDQSWITIPPILRLPKIHTRLLGRLILRFQPQGLHLLFQICLISIHTNDRCSSNGTSHGPCKRQINPNVGRK